MHGTHFDTEQSNAGGTFGDFFFSITPLSQALEQERRYSNKLRSRECAQERQ